MRVLLVADERSPIARAWYSAIQTFATTVCLNGSSMSVWDVCAADARDWDGNKVRLDHRPLVGSGLNPAGFLGGLPDTARLVRTQFGRRKRQSRMGSVIESFSPDIVHVLRISCEAINTRAAIEHFSIPLVVSIWGSDLTMFANRNTACAFATASALNRARGLVADCKRDLELATGWGWSCRYPNLLAPSNGGVDLSLLYPDPSSANDESNYPLVLNLSGLRRHSETDTYLAAAVELRRSGHAIECLWPGAKDSRYAKSRIADLGLSGYVIPTARVHPHNMAKLLRRARLTLFLTTHDGTPSNLLESMASGTLPIATDFPALRDWITDGVNGLLVRPGDIGQLTRAVRRGLNDTRLRKHAIESNRLLVDAAASRTQVIPRIHAFYDNVIDN